MPEMPDVSPGEVVASVRANDIRDRTVQRYADQATLDLQNPTPEAGELAWLDNVAALQMYDGANWNSWLAGGGVRSVQVTSSVFAGPRSAPGQPVVRTVAPGTAAAPTYTFHQFTDAGMWADSGAIRIARGGADVISVGTFCTIPAIADQSTGSAANVHVSQTQNGRLLRSTSARKYKTNIESADSLADLVLEPVTFHRDDDDDDFIGFIADDMPDNRAIVFDADGEVENYDLRAVVAILAAKVNRLEAQIANG